MKAVAETVATFGDAVDRGGKLHTEQDSKSANQQQIYERIFPPFSRWRLGDRCEHSSQL